MGTPFQYDAEGSMTGEMSVVTKEAYPLHFAVVERFGGSVHPFDTYQGPYISYKTNVGYARFFLVTDDGVFANWYNETSFRYSPTFTATDDADDLTRAVEAFRVLAMTGGSETPERADRDEDDTHDGLLQSLACYVTGDDVGLDRKTFLRYVADRINDDLNNGKVD
jgi:hypothetical protein